MTLESNTTIVTGLRRGARSQAAWMDGEHHVMARGSVAMPMATGMLEKDECHRSGVRLEQ